LFVLCCCWIDFGSIASPSNAVDICCCSHSLSLLCHSLPLTAFDPCPASIVTCWPALATFVQSDKVVGPPPLESLTGEKEMGDSCQSQPKFWVLLDGLGDRRL
jgi:hypothetical protein